MGGAPRMMRSLRSRLVLGFALVAVVPLALALFVLSQRIRSTVRSEASERLGAALSTIEARQRADAERALQRLEIVARDGSLRRLALVQPVAVRDLAEFLDEKRFLLGLDFLSVTDLGGHAIADAATAPAPLAAVDSSAAGLEVRPIEGAALAIVASTPILYQGEPAAMLRGGFRLDATRLADLARASDLALWLRDGTGRPVASTRGPDTESGFVPPADGAVAVPGSGSHLARTVALGIGPEPRARLTALVSTAAADRSIAALRMAGAVFGLLGLAVAIALGVLWSLAVSRPVERIARFSEGLARGEWEEALALSGVREIETLGSALDRMRSDLRGYRERLVASERHEAWSLMARAVAHEVRNPLTPIAVSVADLRRSYQQQRPDFGQVLEQAARTIDDEIASLKRMLHEFAELGRFPEPVPERVALAEAFADLETLYGGDVERGRLAFARLAPGLDVRADRGQLRQALVNLIKNGLEAIAPEGRVDVSARAADGVVEIAVADDGPGMNDEQREMVFAPHFTTKPQGFGLGLTIVHRIVNDHGGTIAVESAAGRGTVFRIRLPSPGDS